MSVEDVRFFDRNAKAVAIDLLGKYICYKNGENEERFLIVETEAYNRDDQDKNEKHICYGAKYDKEYATNKNLVCAPLFEKPGTWCIYGGQLLLSVNNDKVSDNVLIKRIREVGFEDEKEGLGPDKMACRLHLYKKCPYYRIEKPISGSYSLSNDSVLQIVDGDVKINYSEDKRININSDDKLKFSLELS